MLTFYLAFYLTFSEASGWTSGSAHWALDLPLEVRQCPLMELTANVRQCSLRSGARGERPAVPSELWTSRLKSGSAHWALELAANVRQCPRARGWRPAVPTAVCSSWLRRSWRTRRRRRRRTGCTSDKIYRPHLAGGEKKVGWDPSPPSLALWWSPPGTKWLQWALPRRSPSLCWAKSCVCRAAAGASPEFPRLGRGNRLKRWMHS